MSERKRSSAGGVRQTAILCGTALLMGGMLSGAEILLLGKLVENRGINLEDLILPMTLIGICGALFSGYLLTKLAGLPGLFSGLVSGGFFTVVFLGAFMVNGIREITWCAPLKILSFVLGGMFGGALAAIRPKRRKHSR